MKEKLVRRATECGDRMRVLGWTNQMPRLMLTHHLVVTKAGGATVQEAIAGRCPMILNQVIPGQEDGNAQLVEEFDVGVVAEKNREVVEWIGKAFAGDGQLWKKWRDNLAKFPSPTPRAHRGTGVARMRVGRPGRPVVQVLAGARTRPGPAPDGRRPGDKRACCCAISTSTPTTRTAN